jgi:diaminopimelate epimerase
MLETKAGRLRAWRAGAGNLVGVDMGSVRLKWQDIPLSHENNDIYLSLSAGPLQNPVTVNVGNPHAVFFVEDTAAVDLALWGPQIENHVFFPERTNVEAAQVIDKSRIRMRVWERGAGITRACGTGACAVAVAGALTGRTGRQVTVELDGGTLDIFWQEGDNHVLMTGPVAEVYRGVVADAFLS